MHVKTRLVWQLGTRDVLRGKVNVKYHFVHSPVSTADLLAKLSNTRKMAFPVIM